MDKVPQCARERSESRIMTFIIQWATYDGATALVGCQKGPFIKDVGKFSRFLSPAPLPSAFQQNAYEVDFWSREFLVIHREWKWGKPECENLLYLLDMSFKVYRMNYHGNSDNNELLN